MSGIVFASPVMNRFYDQEGMNMQMKAVAVAVLAVVSMTAQAGDLGTLAVPSSTSFNAGASTGTLNETWTFEIASSAFANASLTNTVTVLNMVTLYGLSNFSAKLDGNALSFGQVITTSGIFAQAVQTLSMTPILIGAGSHTLTVTGNVTGAYGGGYTGTLALAAAPVPEPETYAMMLAGLGALGFLARRRRQG